MPKLPAFSLRTKLALLAVLLLALPWAGYSYVREMERFLLEGEEQALLATARGVATALHDRPGLLRAPPSRDDELRREAEEELRRLAAERGEAAPEPDPAIIDREESVAARREIEEIAEILRGVERTTSRIWVVTHELRVLALAGSLKREGGEVEESFMQRALGLLIPRPNEDFDDAIADDVLATGREISGALAGRPGVRLRNTSDGKAVVISAAHPIWNGDEVAGAVVVEESTNPILSVRSLALERLLVVTLAVFAFAGAALIWFATRISTRIRRLRDEAEAAIDAHGRVRGSLSGSAARDEIGDLTRSFGSALSRLTQYASYQEAMAGRLSHELRTPIVVALQQDETRFRIVVTNLGPALPETMQGRLFDSMVSVRDRRGDGGPHLGLGLYIVRMIAEFHGGRAIAANRDDGQGVTVSVTLPLVRAER